MPSLLSRAQRRVCKTGYVYSVWKKEKNPNTLPPKKTTQKTHDRCQATLTLQLSFLHATSEPCHLSDSEDGTPAHAKSRVESAPKMSVRKMSALIVGNTLNSNQIRVIRPLKESSISTSTHGIPTTLKLTYTSGCVLH